MSLLSANDRFEILDLCSRYNRSMDHGDADGAADCWSKSSASFETPTEKLKNWDQVNKYLQKELHGGTFSGKRHIMFNIVVSEADSVDSALVDAEFITVDTKTSLIVESGSYIRNKVARISMGWKFTSRTQKIDVLNTPAEKAAAVKKTEALHHT